MKASKKHPKAARRENLPADKRNVPKGNNPSSANTTGTLSNDHIHQQLVLNDLIQIKKKKYKWNKNANLLISSISICLSLLIVILMFEWRFYESESDVQMKSDTEQFEDLLDVPQTAQPAPPPPQVSNVQVVEVSDEEMIEEIEVSFDIEITEETKVEEAVTTEIETSEPEEEIADEIFTIVEEQPSPIGGMKAFYEYVSENLKYPVKASRMDIQGRVFVQFVVEKDGSLTDIQVVKGIGAGCDEEAVRVIKNAPRWEPGKQRGRPVRVKMILPIVFKLYER
jgi:protein TonB